MSRVRFYNTLRDQTGVAETEIEAPDVRELLKELARTYGKDFKRRVAASRIYVNGENVAGAGGRKRKLTPADVIDLLPPTAGG